METTQAQVRASQGRTSDRRAEQQQHWRQEGDDGDGTFGDASGEKDALYDQAVEVVLKNRKASISLVQRHLKIGYNRAARLVEDMEKAGLVSAMSGSGQRDILVPARAE